MLVLQDWDERDDDGDVYEDERCMSRITRCHGDVDLTPQPPYGWWAVVRYESRTAPVMTVETACWCLAVAQAQAWGEERNKRLHMIARTPDGDRVLVVDPCVSSEAHDLVEGFNHARAGEVDDGGWARLAVSLQLRAGRVFLRRMWPEVPIAAIAEAIDESGLDPGLLLSAGPAWLTQVRHPLALYMLMEATIAPTY